MFKFSRRSEERMQGIHPDLVLIATEAIKISPIDFGIPADGGVRTVARQHEMFMDPDIQTNCDGITTQSNHQAKEDGYGHALDVYAYINGEASWKRHHMAMIHTAFQIAFERLLNEDRLFCVLAWGGTFGSSDMTGWDSAHHELRYI